MSSATVGPAPQPEKLPRSRDSFVIVVSTLPTGKLRCEPLDASQLLIICSLPSTSTFRRWQDVLQVTEVPKVDDRSLKEVADASGSARASRRP